VSSSLAGYATEHYDLIVFDSVDDDRWQASTSRFTGVASGHRGDPRRLGWCGGGQQGPRSKDL